MVLFRGPLGPRVPAEAGVPSRSGCGGGFGFEGFLAVGEVGAVLFRGPLGPRVPAEAGVPSRLGCGGGFGFEGFLAVGEVGAVLFRGPLGPRVPAEAGVPSRLGCGGGFGFEGFLAVGEVGAVLFRGPLGRGCRLKPAFQAVWAVAGVLVSRGFGCGGGWGGAVPRPLRPRVPAEAGVPSRVGCGGGFGFEGFWLWGRFGWCVPRRSRAAGAG